MQPKKKGIALIAVLLVFGMLMLVGTILLDMSLSGRKQAVGQVNHMKAYYTAQSGANAMASYIIQHPSQIADLCANTSEASPGTGTIDSNNFQVYVSAASQGLMIKSESSVRGRTEKVSLYLKNMTGLLSDFTVFSDNALSFGNNVNINGNIGTNANMDPLLYQSHFSSGTLQPNMNLSFPPTDPSEFTTLFSASYRPVDGDKKYFYTTGNITDALFSSLTWSGSHSPGGTAEIHLYTADTNSISIRNIDPPDGIVLYLYYNGTNNLTINNGVFSINNCAIYAPNAEFVKVGGGNGNFNGIMIVKDCTLPNSHSNFSFSNNINVNSILGAQVYKRETWGN